MVSREDVESICRSIVAEGQQQHASVEGWEAGAHVHMQSSRALLQGGELSIQDLRASVDIFFMLLCGFLVFMMQLGFAMLCAGLVRAQNANNIMLKNVVDAGFGSISFYILGYGFSYGASSHRSNAFIGNHDFGLTHTTQTNWGFAHPEDDPGLPSGTYASYFFQWTFAATAATIVSGALAERCTFQSYMLYSILMAAWVYPVVVHAVWSPVGWLSPFVGNGSPVEENAGQDSEGNWTFAGEWNRGALVLNTGAFDFAGSGVVHLTGGTAALVGAVILGPRLGRFKDGRVQDEMNGSSTVLVVLGTVILWFSWLGFNCGSNLAVATPLDAAIVSRVAVNTALAGGAGGITLLIFRWWRTGHLEVLYTCNGVLSGLVGVTAGCAVIEPWAAIICGSISALCFYGSEVLLLRLEIDDPVSASSLHGAAGAFGVLFVGFLAKHDYVKEVYGYPVQSRRYGWFYGGHGQLMLCQFLEVAFIAAWVTANMAALFLMLSRLGRFRVPMQVELTGLDVSVHGSSVRGSKEDPETDDYSLTGGHFLDVVEPSFAKASTSEWGSGRRNSRRNPLWAKSTGAKGNDSLAHASTYDDLDASTPGTREQDSENLSAGYAFSPIIIPPPPSGQNAPQSASQPLPHPSGRGPTPTFAQLSTRGGKPVRPSPSFSRGSSRLGRCSMPDMAQSQQQQQQQQQQQARVEAEEPECTVGTLEEPDKPDPTHLSKQGSSTLHHSGSYTFRPIMIPPPSSQSPDTRRVSFSPSTPPREA